MNYCCINSYGNIMCDSHIKGTIQLWNKHPTSLKMYLLEKVPL